MKLDLCLCGQPIVRFLVQSLVKAWQTKEQRTPIQIYFVSVGDVHCTRVEQTKYRGNGVNSTESPIYCAWKSWKMEMRATKCTKAFSKGWSTLQTRASYTNYHQQQQHQLKPPKCNTKNIRVCSTLPILAEKKLFKCSCTNSIVRNNCTSRRHEKLQGMRDMALYGSQRQWY